MKILEGVFWGLAQSLDITGIQQARNGLGKGWEAVTEG